jgi:hypothetical protein
LINFINNKDKYDNFINICSKLKQYEDKYLHFIHYNLFKFDVEHSSSPYSHQYLTVSLFVNRYIIYDDCKFNNFISDVNILNVIKSMFCEYGFNIILLNKSQIFTKGNVKISLNCISCNKLNNKYKEIYKYKILNDCVNSNINSNNNPEKKW